MNPVSEPVRADEPPSASAEIRLSEFDLGYYGWRVVLAACFGVMAGFGSLFVYTFTVFVKPLSSAFGWNRESISLGFGLAAMTVGACSPLIGRLIDRVGPRRIILPSMTVFTRAISFSSAIRMNPAPRSCGCSMWTRLRAAWDSGRGWWMSVFGSLVRRDMERSRCGRKAC